MKRIPLWFRFMARTLLWFSRGAFVMLSLIRDRMVREERDTSRIERDLQFTWAEIVNLENSLGTEKEEPVEHFAKVNKGF